MQLSYPIKAIEKARLFAHRSECANRCLKEAERLLGLGMAASAKARALDSLRCSVGIYHPAYKMAKVL